MGFAHQRIILIRSVSLVMLTGAVILSLLLCTVFGNNLTFPPGFKFGATTSAYQVEGGWNSDGKGVSVWDMFVHQHSEMIADHSSGDVACDSYNLWEEDVRIAAELGLQFYRFSISWSRILPTGLTNTVSEAGVKYYSNLIDGLHNRGIEPIITLHDFDLPKKIQEFGGWTNPVIVDWFGNYARIVYTLYADRVRTWITINEPANICDFAYNTASVPPMVFDPYVAPYLCNKYVLMAHAKAWRIYNEEFRPLYGGKVSISNNLVWMEAKTKDEEPLAELARQNMVGRYSYPIYSKTGGWPPTLEKLLAENSKKEGYKKSRLPAFTEKELAMVKGTYDFYAFSHYSSRLVRQARPWEPPGVWYLDGAPELRAKLDVDRNWTMGAFKDLPSYPEGLRKQISWLRKEYGDLEFFITGNGYSSFDDDLYDEKRVQYMKDYLEQLVLSINEDGANVTGYTVRSLMDNFEWRRGYVIKSGLYKVDFKDSNRKRSPRLSAFYYQVVIKNHTLNVPESVYASKLKKNSAEENGPFKLFILCSSSLLAMVL